MNMPDEMEFYTHRSGRTARAGKKGISMAIISKKEIGRIQQVERSLKRRFTKMNVPTGDEVCQNKLLALVHKVKQVEVNDEEIDSFLPEVYHELKDLSKEDIIKRFASIEFNRFLEYYRDARDLNKSDKTKSFDFEGEEDRYTTGDRIFINIGKMDELDKGSLLGLICDFGEVSRDVIGKIDLKGAYSFFEVDKKYTEQIMKNFEGVEVRGRQVRLEMTGPKTEKYSEKKKERFWGGKKSEKSGRPEQGGRRARAGSRERKRY
jgi:ATP-dependent RNA helicase DeaD